MQKVTQAKLGIARTIGRAALQSMQGQQARTQSLLFVEDCMWGLILLLAKLMHRSGEEIPHAVHQ